MKEYKEIFKKDSDGNTAVEMLGLILDAENVSDDDFLTLNKDIEIIIKVRKI